MTGLALSLLLIPVEAFTFEGGPTSRFAAALAERTKRPVVVALSPGGVATGEARLFTGEPEEEPRRTIRDIAEGFKLDAVSSESLLFGPRSLSSREINKVSGVARGVAKWKPFEVSQLEVTGDGVVVGDGKGEALWLRDLGDWEWERPVRTHRILQSLAVVPVGTWPSQRAFLADAVAAAAGRLIEKDDHWLLDIDPVVLRRRLRAGVFASVTFPDDLQAAYVRAAQAAFDEIPLDRLVETLTTSKEWAELELSPGKGADAVREFFGLFVEAGDRGRLLPAHREMANSIRARCSGRLPVVVSLSTDGMVTIGILTSDGKTTFFP